MQKSLVSRDIPVLVVESGGGSAVVVVVGVDRVAFELPAQLQVALRPDLLVAFDGRGHVGVFVGAAACEFALGHHVVLGDHCLFCAAAHVLLHVLRAVAGGAFELSAPHFQLSLWLYLLVPLNWVLDVVSGVGGGVFEPSLREYFVLRRHKLILFSAQSLVIVVIGVVGLPIELPSDLQLLLVLDHLGRTALTLLVAAVIGRIPLESPLGHYLVRLIHHLLPAFDAAVLVVVLVVGGTAFEFASDFEFALRTVLLTSFSGGSSLIAASVSAIALKPSLGHDVVLRNGDLFPGGDMIAVGIVVEVAGVAVEVSASDFEFSLGLDLGVVLDGVAEVVAGVGAEFLEPAFGEDLVVRKCNFLGLDAHALVEVVLVVVGLALELAAHLQLALRPHGFAA